MLARYEVPATVLGWVLVDAMANSASWAAKHGSEPATEPDVVLSRRNKPITDFICFGFDSPPSHNFFFQFFFGFVFNRPFLFYLFFDSVCECFCVEFETVLPIMIYRFSFLRSFSRKWKEKKSKKKIEDEANLCDSA